KELAARKSHHEGAAAKESRERPEAEVTMRATLTLQRALLATLLLVPLVTADALAQRGRGGGRDGGRDDDGRSRSSADGRSYSDGSSRSYSRSSSPDGSSRTFRTDRGDSMRVA